MRARRSTTEVFADTARRRSGRGRKPLDGWSGRGLRVAHRPAFIYAGALVSVLVAGCGSQAPKPIATPIGVGPEFRPPAGIHAPCRRGPLHGRYRAHVELFLRRRVVVVPAGIGVGRPWHERFGRIESAHCRAELRTLDPTGVVEFDRNGLTMDDVFRVWGHPFAGAAYVGGKRVTGPIPLTDGAEIVLEAGGYVPPHRSFLFPPR
jgi:hypothetical protein